MSEAGSAAAIAAGFALFGLLTAAGLAGGLGVLALLRTPADPVRRLLLAPFAATMVWALTGNLMVRFGLTMAQATPLLRSQDVPGLPARFRTPEFALVGLGEMPLVERVDSPNQLEPWGTWLGTRPITVSVLARPGRALTLSFEATPGPSLPGTPRRVILLRSGAREVGRIEIDGRATVVFPFTTAGGREVLTLSTPQAPTVSRQPNGDTRPLLVGIRDLRVGLASDEPTPRSR